MNKKKIMIGKFALIGALVMSAFSWGVINRFNEPSIALANHLTPLTAAEVSTLRWNSIANFYGAQNESLGVRVHEAGDLTSLNAAEVSSLRWNAIARDYETQAEVSTLRWNAMAKIYESQNESQGALANDLPKLSAAEVSTLRWNAMAKFYAAQNE